MAHRASTVGKLPAEIRELIGRLRNGGSTIDEILAKLRELQVESVSRSALGRHVKQLDAIGEEIRRSRTIAEAMVQRFGDAPESKTARLNIELMHGLLMKLMVGEEGESKTLDPQEAYFAATALQRLAMADKSTVDREVKVREKLKAETAAKLKTIEAAALAGATTAEAKASMADVLKRIRQDVYGIMA